MTPAPYPLGMTYSKMTAATLALYLRRIQLTRAVPALNSLSAKINREFPTDEATPRLLEL